MSQPKNATPFRIGHGFDVHRFSDQSDAGHVILAGIKIPCEKSLIAHSDGDVVAHAICDALLGAIAAGDIGKHFPDTDARYRGIDSMVLLKDVYTKVCVSGYKLGNLDVTVVAQIPMLSPHIAAMCERIAQVMRAENSQINIKATTTEKLGYVGRAEGTAVHAVVLLERAES
jgi:2-C-methyl-D-erythritol 2,4-cyclodiphosphate synthase